MEINLDLDWLFCCDAVWLWITTYIVGSYIVGIPLCRYSYRKDKLEEINSSGYWDPDRDIAYMFGIVLSPIAAPIILLAYTCVKFGKAVTFLLKAGQPDGIK